MNLSDADKQKAAEAINAYVQSAKANPSIANCSMCDGHGKLHFDEIIDCPRCEGSGRYAPSFVITLGLFPSVDSSKSREQICRECGEWYEIDQRLNDGFCNECREYLMMHDN